jgi:hypothetical protein
LGDSDDPGSLGGSQARESGESECCELHLEVGGVCVCVCVCRRKSEGTARRRSD